VTYVYSPSATLTGNKAHVMRNADGKQDDKQILLFSSRRILEHPEIQLTHGGFILIELMSGGDYDTVRTGPSFMRSLFPSFKTNEQTFSKFKRQGRRASEPAGRRMVLTPTTTTFVLQQYKVFSTNKCNGFYIYE
jgi:hypothetical protein